MVRSESGDGSPRGDSDVGRSISSVDDPIEASSLNRLAADGGHDGDWSPLERHRAVRTAIEHFCR